MDQQNVEYLPFVEQIIDQVLKSLTENSSFDTETLARLHELSKSNGLVKYDQVVSALSTDLRE